MEEFNQGSDGGVDADINHDDDGSIDADSSDYGKLLRQIESDDPDLVKLKIGHADEYFPDDRFGKAIGKNSHLKELRFLGLAATPFRRERVTKEDFDKFFRGLFHNRSIQKMSFVNCNLFAGEILRILIPFFTGNHNFESLEISLCDLGSKGLRCLSVALSEFNSLKEFALSSFGSRTLQEVIKALGGHSRLRTLNLRENNIGKNGCDALATLLQNPNSGLAVLDLYKDKIDDKGAIVLATALAGNNTLIDLNLGSNRSITITGWRATFAVLQSPHSRLESLSLRDNNISDDAALSLMNALSNNNALKALELGNCSNITIAGWWAFFGFLLSPNSILEELNLHSNRFNDDLVISLATYLASNSTLKRLNLSSNRGITNLGWQALSAVLENPYSALEKLDLGSNRIDDDAVISFANSLTNNTKVTVLLIAGNHNITNNGWAAFSRMLCNKSSIMDTYLSNHTLQKFCVDRFLPNDLRSLLRLNKENSKSEAARLKIISHHFSGNYNIQPFIDMELKVLPRAIAWMAKDEINDTMYRFIRITPSLFERAM